MMKELGCSLIICLSVWKEEWMHIIITESSAWKIWKRFLKNMVLHKKQGIQKRIPSFILKALLGTAAGKQSRLWMVLH